MYSHLLRKDFNLKLKIGGKEIIVKYKQATIGELFEFLTESQNDNFDLVKYIFDFIEKNASITLKDLEKEEIMIKTVELFEILKKTLFKTFFNEQKGKKGSKTPFSSFLMVICDKFSCDPKYLLDNYTWEQITVEDGYLDGIIWNANEQTKEGQQKNKQKNRFKETFTNSIEEDLKIAQKAIKK